MLSLIVAMTRDQLIGKDGKIPWHLPEDLKHFKSTTTGCPIVMGRKTYESIGRPLPNRRNIVLSRDPHFRPAGVEVYARLEDAFDLLRVLSAPTFVIGGGEVYAQAMPFADALIITWVDHQFTQADYVGATFFPVVQWADWELEVNTRVDGKGFWIERYTRRV
jgi:dihydrofolate reductase